MQPLVTIAIPTYNRADSYLPGVIEAARNQTWPEVEILVGDNGSTDGTSTLIDAIDDERLRYIRHEENIGANANFNHLLEEARGEWFLLLHDDDLVDPDFVESCLSVVEPGKEYGFLRTGVRAIDANGKVLKESPNMLLGPSKEDFYLSWFQYKTSFFLCNTLYHTERLREIGGFHSLHNLLEDNFALVKLLQNWSHGDLADVKASYRYTYDQRTYQVPVVEWCEDFQELLNMIVAQCRPESQETIRKEGSRFFGTLSVRRANAIESRFRQARARLAIARHFGTWSLRIPWTN
jgi:glycosyltransferase involved in cell wall biosynthesis